MKQTIPFNFDEIYKQLEKEFSKRGYDAIYEGSNIAQLITAMSYVTSMLNINTAVNINETLLTLAEKRNNILQDARILGYEASKVTSYRYELTLKFNQVGKFLIPKYSVFESNGNKYYYLGQDISIDIKNLDDMNHFRQKIEVKEGNLIRFIDKKDELVYLFNGSQNYIDIPYVDVEDDGLEIFATYYDPIKGKIDREQWVKSKILLLDKRSRLNKEFIRQDNIETKTPRCFFSFSGIGHELPAGTVIEVNILQSKGDLGVAGDLFIVDPRLNFCELDKSEPVKLIATGTPEESDKSIKDNAPLMHNTAARTVTGYDYKAVANSHAAVKDSIVWGGEDEVPVKLGNIYYSFLPSKNKRIYDLFSKINGNYIRDGENKSSTISERYNYFLRDSIKNSDNYISNNELLSQNVNENGEIISAGVWDLIDKYKLPALDDNLRNPVYVYVDFYIDIKKYKTGIPQSEIRQKVFDKLSERMSYLEHFDTTFFKSNIIKQLDEELSDIMGLSLKPKFYILLNKENIAKKRIKSIFSNATRAYINLTQNQNSAKVSVWLPVSVNQGDEVSVKFNKPIVLGNTGSYKDSDTLTINLNDIQAGIKSKEYDLTAVNLLDKDIQVKYITKDETIKLEGTDIQYFNLTNKRVYFYPNISSHTSQVQIILPKFAMPGDKIKVIAHYGNTQVKETSLVEEYIIKKNDKLNNFIEILDRNHGSYAGIIHPLSFEIQFTKAGKDNEIVRGETCSSLDIAKSKTKTQNEVFEGLNLAELYYDFFIDENKINVTVYIPKAIAKPGDKIIIQSKTNLKNSRVIEVTEQIIQDKLIQSTLEIEPLKILDYSYKSIRGESIGMYPLYYKDKLMNLIEDINDDSLNIHSKVIEIRSTYQPNTSLDGKERFKEQVIEMYANAENYFDVRNLVINLKPNSQVVAAIPPNSELGKEGISFNYPYIIWKYPRKNFKQTTININISGDNPQSKNYILKVLPLSSKNISDYTEGDGGIFIYLDFPFEGLYDNGKLQINRLPKIDTDNFNETKKIVVDTTINEETAKRIFPYVIPGSDLDNLNHQSLEYISFPIKIEDEVVGTYTIFNSRIPYIRVKLKRVVAGDNAKFLSLEYPTDNIHFIRNNFLKLRNVYFDTGLAGQ